MTSQAICIFLFTGVTIGWFVGAWVLLRNPKRDKPGWGIVAGMELLAGFQTLMFTFIIAGNSDWLRLANAAGWPLLAQLPIITIVAVFAFVRLLYGKTPE